MAKGNLVHVYLNVSNPNLSFSFYKQVLGYLGYEIEYEDEENLGLNNGSSEVWLRVTTGSSRFDRADTGINHLAFEVASQEEVEKFVERIITPNRIPLLYDSPKIFEMFNKRYYAAYFEDPDGIKVEVGAGLP